MKKIILIIFLLLIASLILIVFNTLNHPSKSLTESQKQQALKNILGRPVVLTEKLAVTGNVLHKGKYVSFMYPKVAKEFVAQYNGAAVELPDLESFGFDLKDPRAHVFTAVLDGSSLTNLTDNPSVSLRQSQSGIYHQLTVTADGQSGLAFEKYDITAGYEKTGFFLVNGKIYSFSVQSADQQTEADLFNKIISTTKFLD